MPKSRQHKITGVLASLNDGESILLTERKRPSTER